MVYECEIVIRREDPHVLADDFRAVTTLLEQRKAERGAQHSPPDRPLRLVPAAHA